MKLLVRSTALAGTLLVVCGCSAVPSQVKSLVFRTPDKDDPLANIVDDEVSKSYKSAKKELDRSEETLLKFARWREDMGDHAEAKTQYKNILADNRNCVEARLGIARVEFETGRVAEAVEILQATARKFPERGDTWAELGRIQSARQEWGQAVQSLTRAYDLDPANQSVRYELGVALARSDRLEEGRTHLTYAVGESAALYNIGFVLHESGRSQEAAHWFRRALNSHPDQRTERAASQMLAQLNGNGPAAPAERQANRVNVALTNYESWRENPGMALSAARQQQQPTGQTNPAPPNQQSTRTVSQQYNAPQAAYAAEPAQQWQGPQGGASLTPSYGSQQQTIQPQQWNGPHQ